MRVALVVSLIAAGAVACDEDVPFVTAHSATPPGDPPQSDTHELTPPPAPAALTFDAPVALGDADCFSAVELSDTQVVLAVSGERRALELITIRDRQITRELVADIVDGAGLGDAPARVPSCALSLDGKGGPEIVYAVIAGDTRATFHLRKDGTRWVTTTVADFAAWQVALNARSPRGSEVMLIDAAARQLHAFLAGDRWQPRPLPAPALADPDGRALALAVDTDGRSHFALGSDYYGDRGDGYAFWPGDRPRDAVMTGAVAIVLDPADDARLPQIVYARRDVGSDDRASSSDLYRAVIGPDSAQSFMWDEGLRIVGHEQHLAPYAGQIAARIDADGYLHTACAVMHLGAASTTWSARYVHDRPHAPRAETIRELRATGTVAFAAADTVIASDHGQLRAVTRASTFPEAEPADLLAPPSVGAVDRCTAGPADDDTTVLRALPQLSTIALAAARDGDSDGIHALEWAFDRMSVRHTAGDAIGWTTSDVAPWHLDTMRAGRSAIAVTASGAAHLAWPEGDGLVHWTNASGHWVRRGLPVRDVVGTPDLAVIGDDVWLAAIDGRTSELVVARFDDGVWELTALPSADGAPAVMADLVAGAATPTVLVAERPAEAEQRVVMATWSERGWTRVTVTEDADRLTAFRSAFDGRDIVAIGTFDDQAEDPSARDRYLIIVRIAPDGAVSVLSQERAAVLDGTRALDATPLLGGGVMVVYNGTHALHGVRVDRSTLSSPATLAASADAFVRAGIATASGRLVMLEQRPDGVALVGQACAR